MRTPVKILIVACAALMAGAFFASSYPPLLNDDTGNYLTLTRSFTPDPAGAPETIDILYPPGYPFFLDLCSAATGLPRLPAAVVWSQHFLSAATVVLLFLLGRKMGGSRTGWAASGAYALYLPRAVYAQTMLSETLFTFLTVLFAFTLFGALERAKARSFALAGLFAASAAAVRPMGIVLVCVLAVAVIRRPRLLAAALAPLGAVLLLVILHNVSVYGRLNPSDCFGRHLANAVFSSESVPPDDPGARRVAQALSESGATYKFPSHWWNYWHALTRSRTDAEADWFLAGAAVLSVRSHPGIYLRNVLVKSWGNLVSGRLYFEWLGKGGGPVREIVFPVKGKDAAKKTAHYEHIFRSMNFYDPPRFLGRFADGWIAFWNREILRGRGFWPAILYLCGFVWALAAGGKWRVLALGAAAMHLTCAATETRGARYFEPLVPFAILMLAGAAASAVRRLQTLRTIFPKF